MAPRTKKQFENIREEKKKLIMTVALELFGSDGYHTTSISDIARKADISKGLLYNYFDSKEELIREIINSGIDKLAKLIDPNRDGVLTKGELRYFIENFFILLIEEQKFWKLYFSLFLQAPVLALVEDRLRRLIASYFLMLTNYFESQGYEDPQIESLMFGAILDGIGFNFVTSLSDFPVDRVKEKMIKMYCK